jgi:hypothetical protein
VLVSLCCRVKEDHPELWARLLAKVHNGQFVPVGGR